MFGRRPAPQRAPAPAQAIGAQTPLLLTAADFTAHEPIPGRLSRLATYEVPRGEMIELDTARPFRLALKALTNGYTGTSSAGGEATLDLTGTDIELVQSARPAAALPAADNPSVVVRKTADDTKVTIKSIDYAAGEIVIQGLGNAQPYAVYVAGLPGNGEVKIRAIQPAGVDQASIELYNETLRALHETDQASGITAPRLGRGGEARVPLGPKWLLAIEVDSDALLTIDPLTEPLIQFHAYRVPVAVRDQNLINRAVATRLR